MKLDLSQELGLQETEMRHLRKDLGEQRHEAEQLSKNLESARRLVKRLEEDKAALFAELEALKRENRVLTVAKSGDLQSALSPEALRSYQTETKKMLDAYYKHAEEIEHLAKSNNQLTLSCQEYHKIVLAQKAVIEKLHEEAERRRRELQLCEKRLGQAEAQNLAVTRVFARARENQQQLEGLHELFKACAAECKYLDDIERLMRTKSMVMQKPRVEENLELRLEGMSLEREELLKELQLAQAQVEELQSAIEDLRQQ